MKLFDENIKRVTRFAKYSESHYRFINISDKIEYHAIRSILEIWFSHYPENEKKEFAKRFKTDNNEQFLSAFYELLLHEMLRNLGYTVIIHPKISNSNKRPDYLAMNKNGEEYFLEVAISTNLSREELGRRKIFNNICDIINEIETYDFFLSIKINKYPNNPIPASKLRNFLQKQLDTLDPDLINEISWESVPSWYFDYEGFEIEFKPIAKDKRYRNKKSSKPIGATHYPFQFIDSRKPILASLKKKANKYGNLELPYIIALNIFDTAVDKEDISDVLFGTTSVISDNSQTNLEEFKNSYNSFWYSKNRPNYTRVSALILTINMFPWSIGINNFRLYKNPWGQKSYSGNLEKLSTFKLIDGKYEHKSGKTINEILDLPEKWPHNLSC